MSSSQYWKSSGVGPNFFISLSLYIIFLDQLSYPHDFKYYLYDYLLNSYLQSISSLYEFQIYISNYVFMPLFLCESSYSYSQPEFSILFSPLPLTLNPNLVFLFVTASVPPSVV